MVRRLLLLNGIAVIGVVLNHASGYGFRAMFRWTDRYLPVTVPDFSQAGSLAFYGIVLIQQLIYFTLPAFLFVSGLFVAFSAGKDNPKLQWNVVFSRVKTLLIPLIVWIVIIFLFFFRRFPRSLDDALISYYYIPLLIQFFILAPFIVRWAKQRWVLLLILAAVAELSRDTIYYLTALGVEFPGQELLIRLTPPWLIPTLIFWFTLGVVAGIHRERFSQWLARNKKLLLIALVVLVPLTIVEYQLVWQTSGKEWLGPYFGGYSRSFYALAFLLCFLAYEKVSIPYSNNLSQLGSKSLGVYLAHGPIMYVVAIILYEFTPRILGRQVMYQSILILIGLGISLIAMQLVSKTRLRVAYHYIFG